MSKRLLTVLLFATSLGGAVAGCSGEATPSPSGGTTTENAPAETEEPAPGAGTPDIALAINPAVAKALSEGGLKVDSLPDDLGEITNSRTKTQAVMKSFTIALGVDCNGCHAGSGKTLDYEAVTPQKKVAAKMWSDFVRGLKAKEGTLYCDSCHQGKMKYLDRSDPTVLEEWMKKNFVEKLERRDGQEHDCKTCHGEPFKADFLRTWRK
jgi:hypothetical protein